MKVPIVEIELTPKTIGTMFTAIVTIIGSVFFIEDRYAKAADVESALDEQKLLIKDVYVKEIEDKIFGLKFKEAKGTATPLDKAYLDRYTRQLRGYRPDAKYNDVH